MITFEKIRYRNIMSVGNQFIEFDLSKYDKLLCVGTNGQGKSVLLSALTFVLYGKPFRKGTILKGLINSINKRELVAEIEFTKGMNHYKIIRGISPNIFEIYINNDLQPIDSNSKDAQKDFEDNVLGINYKSFCQIVILDNVNFVPFMELNTPQRRELIEDLLDLTIFTKMNKTLKEYHSENNSKLSEYQSKLSLLQEKINSQTRIINTINENSCSNIKDLENQIQDKQNDIKDKTKEKVSIQNKLYTISEGLKDKQSVLSKHLKLTNTKREIEYKLSDLNKQQEFLTNNDKCNSCKQPIDETFRQNKLDKIESNIKELLSLNEELNKKLEYLDHRLKTLNEVEELKIGLESNYNVLCNSINTLNTEISSIESKISKLKQESNIENEQQLLNKYKFEYDEMNDNYSKALNNKDLYLRSLELLKDDGIKARIIHNYIPVINQYINEYLHKLNFFVEFTLDENFNETILSRFRDNFRYGNFSQGEKMRINLAILFAWRKLAKSKNSLNTNLLIMDEIFDSSLDYSGIQDFIEIIETLCDDSNTIIISHKIDEMYDRFDHVVKMEKKNGFSYIV